MKKKISEEQIFESGIRIFARYGFRRARMDDIAEDLGVAKGTIYRYVRDKADLYEKSVAYGLIKWQSSAAGRMTNAPETSTRIKAYTLNGYDYLKENNDLRTILINDPTIFPISPKEDPYFEINQASMNILKDLLREGIASGEFNDMDVDVVAELLYSVYVMFIIKTYVKSEGQSTRYLLESGIDMMMQGLIKR